MTCLRRSSLRFVFRIRFDRGDTMKRQLFVASCVLLVSACGAAVWLNINRPRISFRCYQRIEVGMTRKQVVDILGGPPRWEVQAKDDRFHFVDSLEFGSVLWEEWWGRDGVI